MSLCTRTLLATAALAAAVIAPSAANAGAQATPALDYAADGRLIGIAGAQSAYAVQTAPAAATLHTLAKVPFTTIEPTRATVASDGSVWTATNLTAKPNRPAQSRLVRYDPTTGAIRGQNGAFLGVRLDALAADGPVADDKTAPDATVSGTVLKRHVNRRFSIWTGLRVKSSEGGQTLASLRLHGKVLGFGLVSLYSAGSGSLEFGSGKQNAALLREAARAHRRVIVHVTMNDWAGNKHIYDRVLRLAL